MTQDARIQRRDDSAWPRGAAPISLAVGVITLVVGLSMAGQAEAPLVPLLVLVAGLAIGATVIVVGITRWLDGGTVPLGLAVISGLVGGLMFANVWAVRTARKRRPAPAG
jgi:hypothetical protein